MLIKCSSHAEFKQFLRQQIPLLYDVEKQRLMSFSTSLTKVWFMDLDPVIPFWLKSRFFCMLFAAVFPCDF